MFVARLKQNCEFIKCVSFTAINTYIMVLVIIFKVIGKILKTHIYQLELSGV